VKKHLLQTERATTRLVLPVERYDLASTLTSGQAFRWRRRGDHWEGVVAQRWVRLRSHPAGIEAETAEPISDWSWLREYLQTDINLAEILASFPQDEPMTRSVAACEGLRLLRQDPWECLASFILSSTKQIVQIQQIVEAICSTFGPALTTSAGTGCLHGFPAPAVIAAATEEELRACKMGFRAPNLLVTARMLVNQEVSLPSLYQRPLDEARRELLRFPGVGEKIANCVLLFAYGFAQAFPVDVWVMKAMRQLYFPKRRPTTERLRRFVGSHFGPNAGYAQQYLFHYMRVAARPTSLPARASASS
jgi:N-glycosylase/DNA lyase